MTAEQRRKYEILASVDKMRYGIEMQAWAKSENNPINEPEVSKVAPGTGNGEVCKGRVVNRLALTRTVDVAGQTTSRTRSSADNLVFGCIQVRGPETGGQGYVLLSD